MINTQGRHQDYLDDQREFFDELVTRDWHAYSSAAWDRSRRFEVARLFSRVSPKTVLDVGCGCGFHDVEIAQMPGVERVFAIDYSPKSIDVANREYPHPNVERRVGDVFELEPAQFDLAVSFQVIEHLRNPVDFLSACRRQVRPGGWVAIATPNRDRIQNRYRGLRGREPEMIDPQHYREFNRAELQELGRTVGLRPAGSFGYGLTLLIPRTARPLLPSRVGLSAGALLPGCADVICQIFQVPAADGLAASTNPVYDATAETYGHSEDRSESARLKRELLARHVLAGDDVLDVGCANGIHLADVAPRAGAAAGLDPSERMLEECGRLLAERGIDNVELRAGTAEELPYEASSFDSVYSYSTLFLVPDGRRAIAEVARILRPGGRAVLDVAGRWNLSQRHWTRWWTEQGHTGFTVFRRRELLELLDDLGLRVVEMHAIGALDQVKYVHYADRFPWLERISSTGERRSLDYRVSNLGPLDRFANRWYLAVEKT